MEVAQAIFRTATPFRAPVPKTNVPIALCTAGYVPDSHHRHSQSVPTVLGKFDPLECVVSRHTALGVRGRQVQLAQRLGEDRSNLDMTAAYCETSGMHAGCQRQEKPSHAPGDCMFLSATAAVASQSRPVDNPGCQTSQASLPVATALQIVCRLQHRRTEIESRACQKTIARLSFAAGANTKSRLPGTGTSSAGQPPETLASLSWACICIIGYPSVPLDSVRGAGMSHRVDIVRGEKRSFLYMLCYALSGLPLIIWISRLNGRACYGLASKDRVATQRSSRKTWTWIMAEEYRYLAIWSFGRGPKLECIAAVRIQPTGHVHDPQLPSPMTPVPTKSLGGYRGRVKNRTLIRSLPRGITLYPIESITGRPLPNGALNPSVTSARQPTTPAVYLVQSHDWIPWASMGQKYNRARSTLVIASQTCSKHPYCQSRPVSCSHNQCYLFTGAPLNSLIHALQEFPRVSHELGRSPSAAGPVPQILLHRLSRTRKRAFMGPFLIDDPWAFDTGGTLLLRRALSCIIVRIDEAAIFRGSSFRFTLNLGPSQHGDIETLNPPTPCFVSIIWPSPSAPTRPPHLEGWTPKRPYKVHTLADADHGRSSRVFQRLTLFVIPSLTQIGSYEKVRRKYGHLGKRTSVQSQPLNGSADRADGDEGADNHVKSAFVCFSRVTTHFHVPGATLFPNDSVVNIPRHQKSIPTIHERDVGTHESLKAVVRSLLQAIGGASDYNVSLQCLMDLHGLSRLAVLSGDTWAKMATGN
ncbi:uncharacterized protein CLUP02_03563 [Colletotrichum lupini]|uniref:Uncharacterized protein n=1 Tax=Colletotrichum lupini TaxID=145971 RepID=A0A9Q8SIU1_9PEZI|nr:uncharacterized protein CLUP02_03563 [Colletotrichum lupini]UQC78089.1 hypothetical protein CLUP02_03563 [Colletotrichum lupini]